MSSSIYAHNDATSPTSGYNSLRFAIDMAKNAMMTCTIAKVMKVTTNGQVAAVGRVDVQPLVQMIDGISQTTSHTTVHNLPYVRMVGGASAVIIDPKVGDIGIVVSCDRDVSAVKQKMDVAPPGSRRRFSIADGIFIGACLTQTPTSTIRFTNGGAIVASVGQNNPTQYIVAGDHVQMKKHGNSTLHITVDVAGNQLIAGSAIVIGPDPYPNDPS
jgi:hypothetical protein